MGDNACANVRLVCRLSPKKIRRKFEMQEWNCKFIICKPRKALEEQTCLLGSAQQNWRAIVYVWSNVFLYGLFLIYLDCRLFPLSILGPI